jgi:hypothetical protein
VLTANEARRIAVNRATAGAAWIGGSRLRRPSFTVSEVLDVCSELRAARRSEGSATALPREQRSIFVEWSRSNLERAVKSEWLDQFEEGNAVGGHAGAVEAVPRPAASPSSPRMTSRRFPTPWHADPMAGRLCRPGRQWPGARLPLCAGKRGRGAASPGRGGVSQSTSPDCPSCSGRRMTEAAPAGVVAAHDGNRLAVAFLVRLGAADQHPEPVIGFL